MAPPDFISVVRRPCADYHSDTKATAKECVWCHYAVTDGRFQRRWGLPVTAPDGPFAVRPNARRIAGGRPSADDGLHVAYCPDLNRWGWSVFRGGERVAEGHDPEEWGARADAAAALPAGMRGCELDHGGIGDALLFAAAAGGDPIRVREIRASQSSWLSLFNIRLLGTNDPAPRKVRLDDYGLPGTPNDRRPNTPRWQVWKNVLGTERLIPPHPRVRSPAHGKIVLAPFSAHANRTWPLTRWLEVERLLYAAGLDTVILDDDECPPRSEAFRGTRLVNEPPDRVIAAVAGAAAFAGNDSGMAHIAGCCRTPSVVVSSKASDVNIMGLYPDTVELGGRRDGFEGITPRQVAAALVRKVRGLPESPAADAGKAVLTPFDAREAEALRRVSLPAAEACAAPIAAGATAADVRADVIARARASGFPVDAFAAVPSPFDRGREGEAGDTCPEHWLATYPPLWMAARAINPPPRRIVEIGCRAGYSAWTFLSALPGVTVHSFDKDSDEHGGYRGAHADARRALAPFGDRWRLTLADSHALGTLPPADAAYVDGDHTEEGAYQDLLLCERSGIRTILIDDVTYLPAVRHAADWFYLERGVVPEFVPSITGLYVIRLPAPPAAPAPADVLVVSAATPGYDPDGLVRENHRRFAERTGYRQEFRTDGFDPARAPAWSKVPFVLDALDRAPWVFWIDADAVFTRPFDLNSLVPDDPDVCLVVGVDCACINTGAMLLRAADWTRTFLRRVWEMGAEEPWASHHWWEQAPVNHLYLTDETVRRRVRLVPHRTFNSYPQVANGHAPGDPVVHFHGLPREERVVALKEYAEKANGAFVASTPAIPRPAAPAPS